MRADGVPSTKPVLVATLLTDCKLDILHDPHCSQQLESWAQINDFPKFKWEESWGHFFRPSLATGSLLLIFGSHLVHILTARLCLLILQSPSQLPQSSPLMLSLLPWRQDPGFPISGLFCQSQWGKREGLEKLGISSSFHCVNWTQCVN